jgi:beta-mannosidase
VEIEIGTQIRIWGGGMYQPSDEETGTYSFYDICDELGIFAWSEFIFSDVLYPINQFLLDNIEPEVRQNVRRINRHPSNCQWAGGNEIEGIAISANQTMSNGPHLFDEVSDTSSL